MAEGITVLSVRVRNNIMGIQWNLRNKSEPGRWIRDRSPVPLLTSKKRRPCQRSHFKAAE